MTERTRCVVVAAKSVVMAIVVTLLSIDATASAPDSTRMHRLRNVDVTATAREKSLASTAPMYDLGNEEFTRLGITGISDALNRLPGVNLRDYGGAGGLKTVSVRGMGAAHTAVIYDGVTLSECQSGEIDLSRYSLDNVSALTMVIGDNDDIFIPARAAASAASLSISTFNASALTDSLDLTAQLKVGSFGLVNPFFRISKRVSSRLALSATGDYTYAENDYPFTLYNGDYTSKERRTNSRMNSGHGELSAHWQLAPRSVLNAKIYYYDNDRQLPGPVIYYNNLSNERLRDRNLFGQLNFRSVLSRKLSVSGLAKFNWASSLYHDENGKYPGGVLDQNYWQREAYASACLLYVPVDGLAFDYSADYAFNNLSSNLPTETRPYRNSVLQSLTARYRTGRLSVTGRVIASIYRNGAKDGEAALDRSRLSPSVSVSVKPFDNVGLRLRASYKSIFRMPTFNESYFFHYGSTTLKPENTDQLNIGLTWEAPSLTWLPSATLTVDGYYNHVRDKIVAVPYNMFVWTVVNLEKVRMMGCDVTLSTTFAPCRGHDIILTGNYSYQRSQPRTSKESPDYNKQVAYTPLNSGSITLSYENPWVSLAVNGVGVSSRYTTNDNNPATHISGYFYCGCSVYRNFSFHGHEMEVRADLINMLDKQYFVVARYPMPGRSWQLTLKFNL